MVTGINEESIVLSNEDIVMQFCLQNKVNKTVPEELLKRGFTSLEALKLVQMDDQNSDKIPRESTKVDPTHCAELLVQDVTADGSTETTEDTNAGGEDGTAALSVQIDQEGEPEPASQTNQAKSNENADLYNKLINNLLSQQQNVITNSQTSASASEPIAQPSWNDPQIHISSASGKLATSYLDICDFVRSSVEEVVLGGQGDQQIIVKSGPKKLRLENLTLCQWSVANLSILYKLIGENKL